MKKNFFKKLWHFYWKEDSLLSYAFFLIVTYLLLRFAIYPGFLFITGLNDIVAIMTSSMEHSGSEELFFYSYFEDNLNYTREEIDNLPFSNGLNRGDVIFVKQTNNYTQGDVIVFFSPYYPNKLVHRLVSEEPLMTKGDNNPQSYNFDTTISEVVGEVVFKIPYLGLPRYWMYLIFGI